MARDDAIDFVGVSAVRTAVLQAVLDGGRRRRSLVDALDASESAVYAAVNALAERRLVTTDDDVVRATGKGVVVAECLDRHERMRAALEVDDRYWVRHDPSVIPARQRRFEALAGAEVIRAADHDPGRVTRVVAERIERASWIRALAPVYHERISEAVATVDDGRFVMDRETVATHFDDPSATDWPPQDVRIDDVPFALVLTDECLLLSLPRLDGSYDARSKLVAETDEALAWGADCFEHVWDLATPLPEAFEGDGG